VPTKTELEMRQGAYIAAMNGEREYYSKYGCAAEVQTRRELLERWAEAQKVRLTWAEKDKRRDRVVVLIADRHVRWIETYCDTWPSEQLIANIGLAIGALDSFNGVKGMTAEQEKEAAEQRSRAEYRKHLTPPSFWDDK
jgi:hypothetical protein